jgi:antitoxin CptB
VSGGEDAGARAAGEDAGARAAGDLETRRKRLRIRAWRRGIKEMDLILGGYADAELATLDADGVALFEAVLGENDHDLFAWVTGQAEPPARYAPLMADLSGRAAGMRPA